MAKWRSVKRATNGLGCRSLPSSSPSLVGWITISWNPSPAFSMGTCCLSKKPLELLSLLKTIGGKLKLGFLPKLLIAGKNPFELSFWTFSLFAYWIIISVDSLLFYDVDDRRILFLFNLTFITNDWDNSYFCYYDSVRLCIERLTDYFYLDISPSRKMC